MGASLSLFNRLTLTMTSSVQSRDSRCGNIQGTSEALSFPLQHPEPLTVRAPSSLVCPGPQRQSGSRLSRRRFFSSSHRTHSQLHLTRILVCSVFVSPGQRQRYRLWTLHRLQARYRTFQKHLHTFACPAHLETAQTITPSSRRPHKPKRYLKHRVTRTRSERPGWHPWIW